MFFKLYAISAILAASVSAHMDIVKPCPRFGPNCIDKPPALPAGASWDYDIRSPIPSDGILCKSNTPWPSPVETWTAGQSITVSFEQGGAAHGGGHCQFSISYDNGQTFAVIHEVLQYCFFNGPSNGNSAEVLSYTFNLPSNLPSSDKAVFAWSWVNAIGNREFYMNCADVAIQGGSSTSYTGKQITIANHNGYPTIPEFSGDYTTGLKYYNNAPMITVKADGSSSVGKNTTVSATPSSPQTTFQTAPSADYTSYPTATNAESSAYITSSKPHKPEHTHTKSHGHSNGKSPESSAPEAAPTGGSQDHSGSCIHGNMRCSAGGSGYTACVWGTWSSVINCPRGTACQSSGGSIVCDWA
ncbi:hypothetical protein GGI25_003641 [Coemansia spiralis]|uniref:Chitin-binding type-4 domain-containing protein n=2 Tax=Coemansia TaxID=4863 RepID=A0A9W8KWC2_9FUNG|nr:hypothetical protein BX070DRAFT_221880 [Coemansia spiralis]KAJ1996130.1 hypothetical protein EDC05_000020 [Coemansia umbellata]KAJ2626113.1 hypothetical protein GGI26_000197 [Coemansia sp. RSA 1358]KAJ2676254.1 hypothetical protein GGI25_003641 [Coemansia spiralis]